VSAIQAVSIKALPPRALAIKALSIKAVFMVMALCLLGACQSGPFEPSRRAQVKDRGAWLEEIKAYKSHDEIYFPDGEESSLLLNALSLSPPLLSQARVRWAGDSRLAKALASFQSKPGASERLVLLGLYGRSFSAKDLTETGRFRVSLQNGAAKVAPLKITVLERELALDYFPVFNRWEKVFALSFPPGPWEGSSLEVAWPAGERRLPLIGLAAESPRP
jgi:hypothetical protein